MNNSVFGKTIENIRKRVDVRLLTSKEKQVKLASKPTYGRRKIFYDNLVAGHKIKETITLKTPAYVGVLLILVRHQCMIFSIIILNKSMVIKQNYYLLIQTL